MSGAATGESINGWFVAVISFLGGVCTMALVICLFATLCGRENRVVQSRAEGESSPSLGQSPKKWMRLNISLSSKRLLSMKKNKAITTTAAQEEKLAAAYEANFVEEENGFQAPVWQRSILMGERCEPPCFSGHIFYDELGNRVQEFPFRSPRPAHTPFVIPSA